MKVLFIARADLFIYPGGDTIQMVNTAKSLRKLGVEVDIKLSSERVAYEHYDLAHFFNIIDPEDILGHAMACKIPYLISSIYVDYSEFDKNYRKDLIGKLAKIFPSNTIEYLKTLVKVLLKGEKVSSFWFFLLGHKGSIKYILNHASYILPNSKSEYKRLVKDFGIEKPYEVVVNAIDNELFQWNANMQQKDANKVICVARIEGGKNQLNLIKAVSDKPFQLFIIGKASNNQRAFVDECHKHATHNVKFISHMSQKELLQYYSQAKVHILPSWFETTGLSSLEAAAMGCNVVIADKGDVREYFGDLAYYCEPSSPESIAAAIELALNSPVNKALQEKILKEYTWEKAAEQTLAAYKKVLKND